MLNWLAKEKRVVSHPVEEEIMVIQLVEGMEDHQPQYMIKKKKFDEYGIPSSSSLVVSQH